MLLIDATCRHFAVIAAMVIVTGAVSTAWGGRIDPELLQSLTSADPADEFAVVVKLPEVADYRELRTSLGKAGKRIRQARVVQTLRGKAITSQSGIRETLSAREREGKVRKVKGFWIFNGVSLTANAQAIRELGNRGDVEEVIPDRIISLGQPAAAAAATGAGWNLDMIGAPILWNLGHTGQGVVVASLDSGVDIHHPALASKWRGGTNSWFDAISIPPSTTPFDDNGHGTNTMGVMVAGNASDNLVGVAPGATWVAAKIFDSLGNGTYSGIHSAFQWLLDPDGDGSPADAPDVVNCSWSIDTAGKYNAEFAPDIQTLTTAGIVVVFAAGNSGPLGGTSVSPANNPGVFSVGATDGNDVVTAISSRGPSAFDNSSIYPTIMAPGDSIRTTDLTGGGNFPDSYVTASGTSLAAPQAAGACALLLSIDPNLAVADLESAVKSAALDLGPAGPDNSYGYGRLDIIRAAENLNLIIPAHIPSGDVDGDGAVTVRDALIVLQAAVGLIPWSATLMYNGDVAPLVNGVPSPDRKVGVNDALLILRKAVGASSF
jgi:serine protease AprX